jgi:predicted neutral ceramidase superfamily lipid hydrolase
MANLSSEPVALDDQALFAALSRVKEHCPDDAMALANHISARFKQLKRARNIIVDAQNFIGPTQVWRDTETMERNIRRFLDEVTP